MQLDKNSMLCHKLAVYLLSLKNYNFLEVVEIYKMKALLWQQSRFT